MKLLLLLNSTNHSNIAHTQMLICIIYVCISLGAQHCVQVDWLRTSDSTLLQCDHDLRVITRAVEVNVGKVFFIRLLHPSFPEDQQLPLAVCTVTVSAASTVFVCEPLGLVHVNIYMLLAAAQKYLACFSKVYSLCNHPSRC